MTPSGTDHPDSSGLAGRLLSPAKLGDLNRSRVLQALVDHGPLSRADLAKMAGVTRATISSIAQNLVDAGLVVEGPPVTGTGTVGKPARPLWFSVTAGLSIALSLHSNRVEGALVNARGEVRSTVAAPIGDAGVITAAVTAATEVLATTDGELLGVGVSVPGVVGADNRTIRGAGVFPGLAGTDLSDTLASSTGLDVYVENDARAEALGEKWFGRARGHQLFASLATGEGLGVAIVIDGVVYRGRAGSTGELGHTCVVLEGGARCRCGLVGCWETVANLDWLRREAGAAGLDELVVGGSAALVEAAAVNAAAEALVDRYADHLAVGLANLVNVFDPGFVIVHGDAARAGEAFMARVREAVARRVLGHLADRVEIVASDLGSAAALLGAAGVVLSATFNLAA